MCIRSSLHPFFVVYPLPFFSRRVRLKSFQAATQREKKAMGNSNDETSNRVRRIRELNDAMRAGACDIGSVLVTSGIQEKGRDFLVSVSQAVAAFDNFTPDNDPYGEHDFGSLELDGEKVFWKIDYYDLLMSAHSPDATDPNVTNRVLTIMLANEY